MSKVTTIGLDNDKSVVQVLIRRQVMRGQVLRFFLLGPML